MVAAVYAASKVLLESMNRGLSDFVLNPEEAQEMIDAFENAAAKAVEKDIRAHAQVWSNKDQQERDKASAAAKAWATRQLGHRVICPDCGSPALVQGNPSGKVTTEICNDEMVQRQPMLPSAFECVACGLRIFGLSKLLACRLGDAFTAKSTYSAAGFFGLYTEEDLEEARNQPPPFQEDFNKY